MLITQPAGSHPFGNPQAGWAPVPREDVAEWYYDYYAVPNQYNGGQTLHGYWMEDSHGQIGVDVEVFGPYLLPGKLHEYGIPDGSFNAPREAYCPQGDSCNKNLRTDGGALWRADIGCASGPLRLRQRLLRHRRPRRVVDVAGVRRDDVPDARRHSGRLRAAAQSRRKRAAEPARAADAELGGHPLRRLDVVEVGRQPLAERRRRHVDAGRELRAERLRPRVQPPPRPAGQLQQPVRRQRAQLHRLLGDDEPRHVQRPGWDAQPLAGPEPGRLRARSAPPAPLQEPARRARARRPGHAGAGHAGGPGSRGRRPESPRVRPRRRPRRPHGQPRLAAISPARARTRATRARTSSTARTARGRTTSTTGWRSSTGSGTTRSSPGTGCCSRRAGTAARRASG